MYLLQILCMILRYPYEHELLAELEQLTREMDRKIQRAKERAEKESAPRPLSEKDKEILDELDRKMKGASKQFPHASRHAALCLPGTVFGAKPGPMVTFSNRGLGES